MVKKAQQKNTILFRSLLLAHIFVYVAIAVFSWGFIDQNFPYRASFYLFDLVHFKRELSTVIYTSIISLLFAVYGACLIGIKRNVWGKREVLLLITSAVLLLFVSFPAFSNDIFNYIATARVAYIYGENPYVVMPIELPNEPMLSFLHASNKLALYGPSWILLTFIPHILGANNLLVTIFTFKLFALLFFTGLSLLIWRLTRSTYTVAFFALNPLVLIETIMGAHNDVAMMFFAVLSFVLLRRRHIIASIVMLVASICIKYATLFVLPAYVYAAVKVLRNERVNWQTVWFFAFYGMMVIFLLSPLREEMYPWYFIWPLTFAALINQKDHIHIFSLLISLGLSFRFVPFVYFRDWGGLTPVIKKIVTFVPATLTLPFYAFRKKS